MDGSQEASPDSKDLRLPESVVELGKLIAQTLGTSQTDLMNLWIGTRIAELMHLAETEANREERQIAAEQCQELILAVWDRRSTWGNGWPPRRLEQIVTALDGGDPIFDIRRRTTEQQPTTWTDILAAALISLERERNVWLAMAARETPTEEPENWLRVLEQLEDLTHSESPDSSEEPADEHWADDARADERESLAALRDLLERANLRTASKGHGAQRDAPAQLRALWQERRSWLKTISRGPEGGQDPPSSLETSV